MRRVRALAAHPVVRNATALSWVQLATFVVPLVTLPYLARTLGPAALGLVVLAQGVMFLVATLVDFGFQTTATRHVAGARGEPQRLARLAQGVYAAKLGLAVVAALGTLVAWAALPKLHDHADLLLAAWAAGVAQAVAPGWYLVGIERMAGVAVVQLAARVVAAALTFVVVDRPEDAARVLWLSAATSGAAALVVAWMVHREVPLRRPAARAGVRELRASATIFTGQSGLALYTSANVVLLGAVASASAVAHFGAAERITRACVSLLGTVTTAVFPRLSGHVAAGRPDRAVRLARTAALASGGLGVLVAVALAVAAGPLVRLVFGPGFEEAAAVLRVLVWIVPLLCVAGVLGGGLMLALHLDGTLVRIVLGAGLTNVVLGLALASVAGPVGLAASVVLVEVLALTGCVLALRRHLGAPRPIPSVAVAGGR